MPLADAEGAALGSKRYDASPSGQGTETYRHDLALRRAIFNGTLPYRSIAYCGWQPVPAEVRKKDGTTYDTGMPGVIELSRLKEPLPDGSRRYHYHGAQKCNNSWHCRPCRERRMRQDAKNINKIMIWHASHGYRIAMITTTLPHRDNDNVADNIKMFSGCTRYLYSGKGYEKIAAKYGAEKLCTRKELTFRRDCSPTHHGAHYHEHAILAVAAAKTKHLSDAALRAELQQSYSARWTAIGRAAGAYSARKMASVGKHGVRIDIIPPSQSAEYAGYMAKGAALYVSGIDKREKNNKRITSDTLQTLALSKRPDLLPILAATMLATQGVPMFRIAPKARKRCGIMPPANYRGAWESVDIVSPGQWTIISMSPLRRTMLAIAEAGGPEAHAAGIAAISRGCDPITGKQIIPPDTMSNVTRLARVAQEMKRREMAPRAAIMDMMHDILPGIISHRDDITSDMITSDMIDMIISAADAAGEKNPNPIVAPPPRRIRTPEELGAAQVAAEQARRQARREIEEIAAESARQSRDHEDIHLARLRTAALRAAAGDYMPWGDADYWRDASQHYAEKIHEKRIHADADYWQDAYQRYVRRAA